MLLSIPALSVAHAPAIGDPDLWWHLRTGEWIFLHHAVPHTDSFCRVTVGTPWAAYSWLFELALYGCFRAFGLSGLVLYTMTLVFAITLVLYKTVSRRLRSVPIAVAAAFLLCFSMAHLYTPRPWLLTILFFAIELDLITRARDHGKVKLLFWLPPLFILWANVHIQFVDGLLVLALFCGDFLLSQLRKGEYIRRHAYTCVFLLFLSVLATFCNPYSWHIYKVAWTLATEPGVLNQLQELQSLPFRDSVDWLILAVCVAAAVSIAKQEKPSSFEVVLLLLGCISAFRSQRDVWILAISAASIIPEALARLESRTRTDTPFVPLRRIATVASVLISLTVFSMSVRNQRLQLRLAALMPVKAVEEVRRQHYAGPVFNDYAWGGYLIWSLREPVSLDGRAGLHGEIRIKQSMETWAAGESWLNDPELASCGYVIAPRGAALTQLLLLDPRFKLSYEDEVAVVFLRI